MKQIIFRNGGLSSNSYGDIDAEEEINTDTIVTKMGIKEKG